MPPVDNEAAVEQTLEMLKVQVAEFEAKANEKKTAANVLCSLIGRPPLYQISTSTHAAPIRSDEFYGLPLATVVRTVLEKRRAMNHGAATVAEIYEAMRAGSYNFETDSSENAKRNLRISLTKNAAVFHKLPSGKYGLVEWYPAAKEARSSKSNGAKSQEEEKLDDSDEEKDAAGDLVEAAAPAKPR